MGRERRNEGKSNFDFLELGKLIIGSFVGAFFRYGILVGYALFWLSEFVAHPKPVDFIAGPFSLVGLWMLLFHPTKLVDVVKNWLR